jgi:magnesium chelatase subunit D
MNPEEGELRPQLLDRFGVAVEVASSLVPGERAEVIRRRLRYEADPEGFAGEWFDSDADLARWVGETRDRLRSVRLSEGVLLKIAALCAELGVDGLRGDIVVAKTAQALAAWEDRQEILAEDVRRAALLALSHRRRRGPFEQPGIMPEELENALDGWEPDPPDAPVRGRGATLPRIRSDRCGWRYRTETGTVVLRGGGAARRKGNWASTSETGSQRAPP